MGKIRVFLLLFFFGISLFAKQDYIFVKDILNREVKIKKDLKRVIALGTSLSYITYLNSSDKIIAIESIDLKDIRKRSYTYVNRQRLKKLPIVAKGAKSKQLNLEMLISLKPDVIFTIMHNKTELQELSSKLRIPMVALSYGKGTIELETIFKSFSIAGKVLNKEKRANELISYIKNLQQSFKEPSKKQEAYIGAISYKGFQGLNSTQADFIPFALAKVNNSASKIKNKGQMFVNDEFLLSYKPKNIFVDSTGWEIIKTNFKKNKEYYKKIQAFKKEKVFMLLANTCYFLNIDQMLASSFFIAKQLYKEQYKELDPKKKANEIFLKFVGENLYDVLKDDLIGFKKILIKDNKLVLQSINNND